MNEEEIAGAGYILKFYQDLEILTDSYAAMVNAIVNIKTHVSTEDLQQNRYDNIDSEDMKKIKEAAETLRFYITRVYIKSQSLKTKVTTFNDKKITDTFKKAKEAPMINLETIEEYVILINTCFVNGILEELLITAKEKYKQLTET